jgi:hypothetical protein
MTENQNVQTVKAMPRLAGEFGSRVVAEGIEDTADLRVIRDLGISFVQGYVTSRPDKIPCTSIPASALSVLPTRDIAVFPELRRVFPVLTSEDQRYLHDGYVLVDGGRYVGLGTADQLVRSAEDVAGTAATAKLRPSGCQAASISIAHSRRAACRSTRWWRSSATSSPSPLCRGDPVPYAAYRR